MTQTQSDPILTQLKRVRGQLDGVIAMYESHDHCIDVVRQVMAVRSSLGSVMRKLLFGEAYRCTNERNAAALQEVLKEAIKN